MSATSFARVASSAAGSSSRTRSYVGAGSVMTGRREAQRRRLAGPALRADVRELLVDPGARIPRGDDLDESLRASALLGRRHRQRRMDRVGQLLDVERVDGQRELAQPL